MMAELLLTNCQIREFLRSREHLLVHFSTVMSRYHCAFPADITNALTLKGKQLSFSTVTIGDTGPEIHGGNGAAEGDVGMLVDVAAKTKVERVCPQDSGSSDFGSMGLSPTEKACADSIDQRSPSNEWELVDFVPIGLYVTRPVGTYVVWGNPGDAFVDLQDVLASFPDAPIYSSDGKHFLRFDRTTQKWMPISYDEIMPPCAKPFGAD